MGIRKSTDGGGIRRGRPWWKRWSRDDTELFALSLPTLLWFLIFTYLPMFGIIIAFKNYRLQRAGMGLSTTCCTVNGRDLEILNISLHRTRSPCSCATRFSTTLRLSLSVQALR
jgi:recombinational DNA repair protein (RecF pathway)